MKAAVKPEILDLMQRAVSVEGDLGFKRHRQGYWVSRRSDVQWELEALYEPAYGAGVFRVGWGVRVAGVAEIVQGEDLSGTQNATVGGDLGSLATANSRMCMLCVKSGRVNVLQRILWNLKPESNEILATRISDWIYGPLANVLRTMTSRAGVISFVGSGEHRRRSSLGYPESREDELRIIAAMKAIQGDRVGAYAALDEWRSLVRSDESAYRIISPRIDEIRQRIEML